MATVLAFNTLANTTHAGLTAYFRATGCTALTIADVLPLLSKITVYEDEYVIGEMKIWDTGSESSEPNNCVMVRVMIYNDGWIVAWFDKEAQNQFAGSAFAFVDGQTLSGFGTHIDYSNQWDGCYLKVTNSNATDPDDPECPDGTIFCIRNTDILTGQITVYEDHSSNNYHFNTGNTYDVDIYMSNGNLVWWNHLYNTDGNPPNLSNCLYRAIYELWESLRYSSNATNTTNTSITKAFLDNGGVFTDYTNDFNDSGVNDCPLMPSNEQVNDAFYFGSANKFNGLNLNIGTAGIGNTIVWEYWDGSAWSSLTTTDSTNGFTVAGTNTVIFTPQEDWSKCFVNSSEQFWIRSRVSAAAYTTQPLLTQGWVIVQDSLEYSNSNLGMYSFEDTSANYCLICGISQYIDSPRTDCYFYNMILPGKTIYNHTISYSSKTTSVNNLYINNYLRSITASTNGFISENIEAIDGDVGIQNVFHYRGYRNDCNLVSILITS